MSCVPFITIMCIDGIIASLDIIDIQVLKALGRSGTVLKLEFIKKPLYIIITIVAIHFNILFLALAVPISSLIGVLINSYCVQKYIGYSLFQKIKDSLKSFLEAFIMGSIVFSLNYIKTSPIFLLSIQIIIGIVSYIILSIIFKNQNLSYCFNLIKGNKGENNN